MSFSTNILKGRIAETIISEMLQEAGYYVYRFGYEGILQRLVQRGLPKMEKGDIEAEIVRTMPDYIVMDKEGDVSFVEVKFRSNGVFTRETKDAVSRIAKCWPETRLLFVVPEEPYFLISRVKDLERTGKVYPLAKEKFLPVGKEVISRNITGWWRTIFRKVCSNRSSPWLKD